MIKATLDTNVLAFGYVGYERPDSMTGAVLRAWRHNDLPLFYHG